MVGSLRLSPGARVWFLCFAKNKVNLPQRLIPRGSPAGVTCVAIRILQQLDKLLHAWRSIIRLRTNILAAGENSCKTSLNVRMKSARRLPAAGALEGRREEDARVSYSGVLVAPELVWQDGDSATGSAPPRASPGPDQAPAGGRPDVLTPGQPAVRLR